VYLSFEGGSEDCVEVEPRRRNWGLRWGGASEKELRTALRWSLGGRNWGLRSVGASEGGCEGKKNYKTIKSKKIYLALPTIVKPILMANCS